MKWFGVDYMIVVWCICVFEVVMGMLLFDKLCFGGFMLMVEG